MSEALPQGNSKNQNGFTVVELVVVIVMISILSAVIFARLQGPNTFNALIIRDQIVSMARIAQQSSLGRADLSLTIQTNSDVSPDSLTLTVTEAGGDFQSTVLDLDGVSLFGDINALNGSNQTPSCSVVNPNPANAITFSNPMIINFDELGDLEEVVVAGAAAASISSAVRICLNNRDTDTVCISPAGFAYAGSCDVEP